MSLMTQSLRRLAEASDQSEVVFIDHEPAEAELPSREPPRDTAVSRSSGLSRDRVQTEMLQANDATREREAPRPVEDVHAEAEVTERPPKVSSEMASLCARVIQDVKGMGESDEGKVIVLVSVRADRDTRAASVSLARSLVGAVDGPVLALDSSPAARLDASDSSAVDVHGFTSLLDGTRDVQDVLLPTDTQVMAVIPSGLEKGSAQAVDLSATQRAIGDCRRQFAYTVVHGGPWQNANLPLVAQAADAVYLVIREHGTERDVAKEAVRQLDQLGIHLRGCILAGGVASGTPVA